MQDAARTQADYIVQFPEWQTLYQNALLELDPAKLKDRIAAADAAILRRRRSLALSANHQAEHRAMDDALAALRVLKMELVPQTLGSVRERVEDARAHAN